MIQVIATAGEEDLIKLHTIDTEDVDILEIRLDLCSKKFLKNDFIDKLRIWKKPLLFTNRLKEDSSEKKHTLIKYEYISFILDLYNSTDNFLDIELSKKDSIFSKISNNKFKIIYSYHDFNGYPSYNKMVDLIKSVDNDSIEKAIFKFAVLPGSLEEDLKFLEYAKKISEQYEIAIIIMGERGIYTRAFGDLFGSSYTYACLTEPRAPGQIKSRDIKLFRKLAGIT